MMAQLIIFKSKAAAEVIMYQQHIEDVLKSLNKDSEKGIITAAELENVIQKIEILIKEKENHQKLSENKQKEEDSDHDEKQKMKNQVSFSARLFPLLEMLRAAHKDKKDVVWGV